MKERWMKKRRLWQEGEWNTNVPLFPFDFGICQISSAIQHTIQVVELYGATHASQLNLCGFSLGWLFVGIRILRQNKSSIKDSLCSIKLTSLYFPLQTIITNLFQSGRANKNLLYLKEIGFGRTVQLTQTCTTKKKYFLSLLTFPL